MIEPEGYHVIVRPEKVEEKTEGGIILPDTTRDMEQRGAIRGEIIAIGPSAKIQYNNIHGKNRRGQVGDRVLYARYGGFVVEEDGEELRILNDEDIIGLII
jgi:chaperonin GroES